MIRSRLDVHGIPMSPLTGDDSELAANRGKSRARGQANVAKENDPSGSSAGTIDHPPGRERPRRQISTLLGPVRRN